MASEDAVVAPQNTGGPSLSRVSVKTFRRARRTTQTASETVTSPVKRTESFQFQPEREIRALFLKRAATAPSQLALKEPGTMGGSVAPDRRQPCIRIALVVPTKGSPSLSGHSATRAVSLSSGCLRFGH